MIFAFRSYMDDDDGLLIPLEAVAEEKAKAEIEQVSRAGYGSSHDIENWLFLLKEKFAEVCCRGRRARAEGANGRCRRRR